MNALITGASSGIGLELARQFATNKIDLILVGRDLHALEAVGKELSSQFGVKTRTIEIDLSLGDAAMTVYKKVVEMKCEVDYLVNDAGFGDYGSFLETDPAKEKAMIMLNVLTLTELCKLFTPGMVARKRGRVLNLASTAAFLPGPFMSVYYATKAYVLSFSEAVNSELKNTGVTVTALCPGPTQSNFAKNAHAENSTMFNRKLPSAKSVAMVGYKAMMRGKSVAIVGIGNNILIFLTRFIPRDLLTSVSRKISKN